MTGVCRYILASRATCQLSVNGSLQLANAYSNVFRFISLLAALRGAGATLRDIIDLGW